MSRARKSYAFNPRLAGLASVIGFFVLVELLIRGGLLNRFIVPPPSEIIASFERVIVEENIFRRFMLTIGECLAAGIMLSSRYVIGLAWVIPRLSSSVYDAITQPIPNANASA